MLHPSILLLIIPVSLLAPATAQLAWAPPPPEYGVAPPRVDLKMAIVMVILVSVFFALGFLSVYTRQCAQRRFRAAGGDEAGFGVGGPAHHNWASRGLDADVIDTFPAFLYSAVKGHKIGKGSLECAVCLCEFEDSERLRLIPHCNHVFHVDCVDEWLVSHSTCPVCRANLVPKPGDSTLAHFLNPVRFLSLAAVEQPAPNPNPTPNPPELPGPEPARTPRSMSTGLAHARPGQTNPEVPRSRSVGHLPVRPGESLERFTLRLPGDVRSRLVANSAGKSSVPDGGVSAAAAVLPRVGSTRRGYRNGSVRRKDGSVYERFEPDVRPDGRWVFSSVPPFVSRSGSSGVVGVDDNNRHKAGSSSEDNVGERSFDALRPRDQV